MPNKTRLFGPAFDGDTSPAPVFGGPGEAAFAAVIIIVAVPVDLVSSVGYWVLTAGWLDVLDR